MQRCAIHDASEVDKEEAEELGRAAVRSILSGETGKMMTLRRVNSFPYEVKIETLELEAVANVERILDVGYISDNQTDVKSDYLKYILPLIGELPEYVEIF